MEHAVHIFRANIRNSYTRAATNRVSQMMPLSHPILFSEQPAVPGHPVGCDPRNQVVKVDAVGNSIGYACLHSFCWEMFIIHRRDRPIIHYHDTNTK